MMLVAVLLSIHNLVKGFLDPEKVTYAINCGYGHYSQQDQNSIAFRPDYLIKENGRQNIEEKEEMFNQNRITIYKEKYDWTIHKYQYSHPEEFIYEIPIKVPGDYLMIFLFTETEYKQKGERIFDIYLQQQIIVPDLDILSQAEGQFLPHAEVFPFKLKNNIVHPQNLEIPDIDLTENRQKLQFNFKSKQNSPKIDAMILYKGTQEDLANDLSAKLLNNKIIDQNFSEEELISYLQRMFKKFRPQNAPILPYKKFFLQKIDEINQQQEQNSTKRQLNSNEENEDDNDEELNQGFFSEQQQQDQQRQLEKLKVLKLHQQTNELEEKKQLELQRQLKEQREKSFLKIIDSFWLWKPIKQKVAGFLVYLGQHIFLFLFLFLNFTCMMVCFRPSQYQSPYEDANVFKVITNQEFKKGFSEEIEDYNKNEGINQSSMYHYQYQKQQLNKSKTRI